MKVYNFDGVTTLKSLKFSPRNYRLHRNRNTGIFSRMFVTAKKLFTPT